MARTCEKGGEYVRGGETHVLGNGTSGVSHYSYFVIPGIDRRHRPALVVAHKSYLLAYWFKSRQSLHCTQDGAHLHRNRRHQVRALPRALGTGGAH
jgi:hypothetical protein